MLTVLATNVLRKDSPRWSAQTLAHHQRLEVRLQLLHFFRLSETRDAQCLLHKMFNGDDMLYATHEPSPTNRGRLSFLRIKLPSVFITFPIENLRIPILGRPSVWSWMDLLTVDWVGHQVKNTVDITYVVCSNPGPCTAHARQTYRLRVCSTRITWLAVSRRPISIDEGR
jgi:hypothetical protein